MSACQLKEASLELPQKGSKKHEILYVSSRDLITDTCFNLKQRQIKSLFCTITRAYSASELWMLDFDCEKYWNLTEAELLLFIYFLSMSKSRLSFACSCKSIFLSVDLKQNSTWLHYIVWRAEHYLGLIHLFFL